MPEITGPVAQGTPCWMNLSAPDAQAAREFYAPLFGWEYEVAGAEYGHYVVAQRRGLAAAGIQGDAEGRASWGLYFAVDDCDAAAERAVKAGAEVVMPADEAGELGRMAVLTDPQGAEFGLWSGAGHVGAEVVDEPGGFVWNELVTADTRAAADFYGTVLGLGAAPLQPGVDYLTLRIDERPVCGIFGVPRTRLNAVQGGNAAWKVYFGVESAEEAVAATTARGGLVVQPPVDSPFGRFAVLTDPFGAEFAAMAVPAFEDQPGG
ncbi:VOC family protein [Actinocorallia sp. API 0066]|uniref:VOC family protein n=1 Tax=Actinocorallia sp. API 0066 TaxID=2896846 RepID=UPI001E3F9F9E|nr:VOC family protein [Actinocorallia sp. API 0066]MCD0453375.1 VOC family protein [Actinocorallia sp. API 0066]